MTDDFEFFTEGYETMTQIMARVAKKNGLDDPKDMMSGPKRKGRRPSVQIADARGEFIYEAYKTGRYSFKHIGKFMRMRGGESKMDYRPRDYKYVTMTVSKMLTRWCKKYNVERPRWGINTRPYWRALDAERERD
jgi:hypothetical protein